LNKSVTLFLLHILTCEGLFHCVSTQCFDSYSSSKHMLVAHLNLNTFCVIILSSTF